MSRRALIEPHPAAKPPVRNPALLAQEKERAASFQSRIADRITAFSGSMWFVLISQNRADVKREAIANQHWATVEDEKTQNQELLDLSRQILELTKAVQAAQDGKASEAAA